MSLFTLTMVQVLFVIYHPNNCRATIIKPDITYYNVSEYDFCMHSIFHQYLQPFISKHQPNGQIIAVTHPQMTKSNDDVLQLFRKHFAKKLQFWRHSQVVPNNIIRRTWQNQPDIFVGFVNAGSDIENQIGIWSSSWFSSFSQVIVFVSDSSMSSQRLCDHFKSFVDQNVLLFRTSERLWKTDVVSCNPRKCSGGGNNGGSSDVIWTCRKSDGQQVLSELEPPKCLLKVIAFVVAPYVYYKNGRLVGSEVQLVNEIGHFLNRRVHIVVRRMDYFNFSAARIELVKG